MAVGSEEHDRIRTGSKCRAPRYDSKGVSQLQRRPGHSEASNSMQQVTVAETVNCTLFIDP